ncbi:carbamoyltransferase [Patescibacteria group bacterium]
MYILGLQFSSFHDTSACLINDGVMVGFVEEERLNRQKHTREKPLKSIDYLCSKEGISIQQIDCIAIGFKYSWSTIFNRILYSFELSRFNPFNGIIISIKSLHQHLGDFYRFRKSIKIFRKKYQYYGKIIFVDHHTAHLCCAFLNSPFKESAILSIDGSGLQFSGKFAVGKDKNIEEFDKIRLPHSIGLLYLKITAYLGFLGYGSEWKVMGLAPYGSSEEYVSLLRDVVKIGKSGKYKLNMKYFKYCHKGFFNGKFELSNYFYNKFGPSRSPEESITDRHKNIAAVLQKITEEVIFNLLENLYSRTGMENICLAGGVAMNSVANGKIKRKTSFKMVYIPIAPYDSGIAIGSAFYIWNCLMGQPRICTINNAFLGPEFSDKEIKFILNRLKLNYSYLNNPSRKAADLISGGNVIGWFQGRMEGGARSLGNRSILADPRRPEMKDIINRLVKYRESFRPFAPSILFEKTSEYFEDDCPVSFMEKVYKIKKDKRKLIPAVTHVDGTGRLQTVRKKDNLLYWKLIKEFESITKIPIVLNTSFNIRGEPIVCTPEDALKCFFGTGLDFLIMGSFLIKKK